MSKLICFRDNLIGALILIALISIPTAQNSFAFQARLDAFTTEYPGWPTASTHECVTCHANNTSGGSSPYRTAFAANSFSFTSIKYLDSDSDGVSNIDEILVGFHPSWKAGDSELATLGVDISSFLTPSNDLALKLFQLSRARW